MKWTGNHLVYNWKYSMIMIREGRMMVAFLTTHTQYRELYQSTHVKVNTAPFV